MFHPDEAPLEQWINSNQIKLNGSSTFRSDVGLFEYIHRLTYGWFFIIEITNDRLERDL